MDTSRNDQLGELAADASLERTDFLAAASAQLGKFLDANVDRIADLGGLVLIDDEVDYLAIAGRPHLPQPQPLPRRGDRQVGQRDRGHREPVRAGRALQPGRCLRRLRGGHQERGRPGGGAHGDRRIAASRPTSLPRRPSPSAPRTRMRPPPTTGPPAHEYEEAPENEEEAAERLYDLALAFQERSQQTEAHLLEQFESAASQLTAVLGDLIIVDDEDERLTPRAPPARSRPRSCPRARRRPAPGASSTAPTTSSSSTTRPTSSATWPTPWPKPSRPRRGRRRRGGGGARRTRRTTRTRRDDEDGEDEREADDGKEGDDRR